MRVSLGRIATTDPAAAVAALLAGSLWALTLAIYAHSRVTGLQPAESWGEVLAVLVLATAAALGFCRHRAQGVHGILEHGTRVPARVERALTYGQFTRVRVAYEWQGARRHRDFLLAAGPGPRSLEAGRPVTLALLPAEPRRAVIRELYETA